MDNCGIGSFSTCVFLRLKSAGTVCLDKLDCFFEIIHYALDDFKQNRVGASRTQTEWGAHRTDVDRIRDAQSYQVSLFRPSTARPEY